MESENWKMKEYFLFIIPHIWFVSDGKWENVRILWWMAVSVAPLNDAKCLLRV